MVGNPNLLKSCRLRAVRKAEDGLGCRKRTIDTNVQAKAAELQPSRVSLLAGSSSAEALAIALRNKNAP